MTHAWKPVRRGFEYLVDLPDPREGREPMRFSVSVPHETSMLKDVWLTVVDYYGRASIPLPENLRLCKLADQDAVEIPDRVIEAVNMLGGIVTGNVLTPEDYTNLSILRKWIRGLDE